VRSVDATGDPDVFCQSFETLTVELTDGVLWVGLGRDEEITPMGGGMFADLGDLFDAVTLRDDVRVLVLRGVGRTFAVGGNVKQMARRGTNHLSRTSAIAYVARMYRHLLAVDQPVIASVNGDAVGAGATLALHCDMILAAEHARFGDPHVLRGLVASVGPYVWPTQVGLNIAKEYLLTGDLLTATEAHRLGMVNHVHPIEDLPDATARFAARFSVAAPHAVRWTKRLLNQDLNRRMVDLLHSGVAHEILTFGTEDHAEGARAFLERRPPTFEGR
jgi:enoyl-CoA hydratase